MRFSGKFPRRGKPRSIGATIALLILAAVGAYLYPQAKDKNPRDRNQSNPPATGQVPSTAEPRSPTPVELDARSTREKTPTISGDGGIGKLYRERTSDVVVTAGGTIAKVLPDDNETSDGSGKHQRFIVRLTTGDTVLIAHNIDLAGRVPAKQGDVIRFCGEYEWTQQGGVVHWTHHDPRGRRADGWIEFDGTQYK